MSTIKKNSTRKLKSKSRSKSKSKSPSPNKTKKTLEQTIPILSSMMSNYDEFHNLLLTNKQYKKQINRISELELRIKKNEIKIKKLNESINENNIQYNKLFEMLYDNDNLNEMENNNLNKLMKDINDDNNTILLNIDRLEAENEELEFLIKIWKSTKINDEEKTKLEKEYNEKYKLFNKEYRNISDKIKKLKNFEDMYPNIEREFNEETESWNYSEENQQKYDNYNEKQDIERKKLMNAQRKLNDDFYRGYNMKIINMIN
jgi:uncharacterized coiled-coil protein SlyX